MPIEYSIDEAKDLLVTTVKGAVTDADVVAYMRELIADPGYRSGMNGVAFTDEIEGFGVTASAIQTAAELATAAEHRFAGSRWAIIASEDPVFGMTRMYELRRDPHSYEVRVFRAAGPAFEWLTASESEAAQDRSD